jgi:hypothetical protein
MPLEPWQLSVLEHVMNGDKVSFVYPKRHSLSEYDAAVKRIYRAFGYEIVSGDGWWGAKRFATTA